MNKKYLKYGLIVVGILIALRLLLSFELVKQSVRNEAVYPLPASMKAEIANDTKGMNADEIIDYSTKRTANILSFSRKNDIGSGNANCIGYASLCAAICQHALNANNIKGRAVPVVGDVRKFGISVCKLLAFIAPSSWKSFVKDHDFVEVRMTDKTVYVDACFYDYFFNDCKMTIKN
jgi:hypothetical protein